MYMPGHIIWPDTFMAQFSDPSHRSLAIGDFLKYPLQNLGDPKPMFVDLEPKPGYSMTGTPAARHRPLAATRWRPSASWPPANLHGPPEKSE